MHEDDELDLAIKAFARGIRESLRPDSPPDDQQQPSTDPIQP